MRWIVPLLALLFGVAAGFMLGREQVISAYAPFAAIADAPPRPAMCASNRSALQEFERVDGTIIFTAPATIDVHQYYWIGADAAGHRDLVALAAIAGACAANASPHNVDVTIANKQSRRTIFAGTLSDWARAELTH